jgi:hypothetical protein
MKRLYKILSGKKGQFALGVAVVGLLLASFAAIAPKAVKAAIATLIRDQDNAARRPFTARCSAAVPGGLIVSCSTNAIPAGEEVVIESISFAATASQGNSVLIPEVNTVASGVSSFFLPPPMTDSGFDQPSNPHFQGGQSVRLYADPGSVISCTAATPHVNPTFLSLDCFIWGYSVSLP